MTGFPRIPGALLIIGILGSAAGARADVIRITGGGLTGDLSAAQVELQSPDHDFMLSGFGSRAAGIYDLQFCSMGVDCAPGKTFSLAAKWSDGDFPGTVSIDGQTYLLGMGDPTHASALVAFDGETTAPAFTGETVLTITAPFTFTGLFFYPESVPPLPVHTLIGGGIARIGLEWSPDLQTWFYTGSRYAFQANAAPVPEPATLLLVGPLAGLYLRRRRGARAQPR